MEEGHCWRPLFHLLTINFYEINWILHYVPFIFYLFLTNSTSFEWVVRAGDYVPKIGQNFHAARPSTSSQRDQAAKKHIHIASEPWAMDWKSVWLNELKGINLGSKCPLSCKNSSKHQCSTTLDEVQPLINNVGETEDWEAPEPGRLALQQFCFGPTQLNTNPKSLI